MPFGDAINYLLRDDFTDTRAAGAMNGTPATPGPGSRYPVDTENLMSLTGGKLVFAGGKASPSQGDPANGWGSFGKVNGQIAGFKLNLPNTTKNQKVGFRNSLSNNPLRGALAFNASGVLRADDNGAVGPTVGAYTANTDYAVAVANQQAGNQVFIAGGAFPNFQLLWVSLADTSTPLIPVISNFDGTGGYDQAILRADSPFLAIPIASDGFSGTGALSATDGLGNAAGVAGSYGQGGAGKSWTQQAGTIERVGGKGQATALSGGIAIATVDCSPSTDYIVTVTLTRAAGEVGVLIYVDASYFVAVTHDGTNLRFKTMLAGVESNVDLPATFGAGLLQVVRNGESWEHRWNNVKIGPTRTVTQLNIFQSTKVGIYTSDLGNTVDDFTVTPTGSRGEHRRLNSLLDVTQPKLITFDGNSLTVGTTPVHDSYPAQCLASLGAGYFGINFGVYGQNIDSMIADAASEIDPYLDFARPKNILVAWEGTIVLASQSAAYAYAALKTYWAARRAAGWKVVAVTILPATAVDNTKRAALNTLIASDPTLYDALADVAANHSIGDDGDNADLTYYVADGTHMTATGYGVVAGIVKTAILTI